MLKHGNVQQVSISKIKPYQNNAKIHGPEQIRKIADSIQEFGFLNPVLLDDENGLLAGHGRVEAAKLLGMDTVPALYATGLSEAQKRAYIIAYNRLGELAQWDMGLISQELADLRDEGFDIDITGFDVDDILFTDETDLESKDKDELIRMITDITNEITTVIHEHKPVRSADHPTMKPIGLIRRQIRNSTRPGENVLDLFGGSGTTLIACEELARKCYMMELSTEYADGIIRRWEEATGKKARKEE